MNELLDDLRDQFEHGAFAPGGHPIPDPEAIRRFDTAVRGKGMGPRAAPPRPDDEPPAAAPAAASNRGPRPSAGGAATSPSPTTATRTHTTARTAGSSRTIGPFEEDTIPL